MSNITSFLGVNNQSLSPKDNKLLAQFPHLDDEGKRLIQSISERLLKRTGGVVFSGPFSELRLVPNSYLTTRPMWIVGCYEQEIEAALLDLISAPPRKIIDIGSAHGYYIVGLATQIEHIDVIGFEAQVEGHWDEARKLAELNGVSERIIQKGFCDVESLKEVGENGSAILCDCEGAEVDILDPKRLPFLKTSRVICEVHDFIRTGATRILVDRFKDTHDITIITEQSRDPFQYRILDGYSMLEKILAVRETKNIPGRLTAGKFLWMRPKFNK